MANIILRTNIANRNFSVEHKIISTPVTEDVVELLITPISGLVLNANDFTTGYLPNQIEKIEYASAGKNVIAKVYLKTNIQIDRDLNISLPISGVVSSSSSNFTFISNSIVGEGVITNEFSSFSKSTSGNTSTYSINTSNGKEILLLNKNFVAPDEHYFTDAPSHNIVGNISRYKVISKIKKNKKGRIIQSNIEVYYKPLTENNGINKTDTISFTANVTKSMAKIGDYVAEKQKDYKIYSINTGGNVGVLGGIKRVIIKGVPGTPFKIIASNASNTSYNFTTGAFTGGIFQGTIPSPLPGTSFGTYTLPIKVPRSTTAETIKITLLSSEEVDHSLIKDAITQQGIITTPHNELAPPSSMTITLTSSGFDFPPTGSDGSNLVIGPGIYQQLDETSYSFNIVGIAAADGTNLTIVRDPKHSSTDAYVNWDSAFAGDSRKLFNSAGVAINNDWSNVTDNKNWRYVISAVAIGIGTADGSGNYPSVNVKGTISGIRYGNGDINPQLDLLNFLTLNP